MPPKTRKTASTAAKRKLTENDDPKKDTGRVSNRSRQSKQHQQEKFRDTNPNLVHSINDNLSNAPDPTLTKQKIADKRKNNEHVIKVAASPTKQRRCDDITSVSVVDGTSQYDLNRLIQTVVSSPARCGRKCPSLVDKGRSIVHHLHRRAQSYSYLWMRGIARERPLHHPVRDLLQNMQLYRTSSPFDRRCTALEWHPTRPNLLAVGSKGGDVVIWDIESQGKEVLIQGCGAGGSIQAMKFWPLNSEQVVTASINGTVTLHDIDGRKQQVLLDTFDCHSHWFCSLDASAKLDLLAAGENDGSASIMSLRGERVWKKKLHKTKISHMEFSPREPWLLCTASLDHHVKLWDVRMIKDKNSMLVSLPHEKGINSAYFNHTDGTRLLVTDQHSDILVYNLPSASLERTIHHPHRFFRHLTPIKAEWHPLQDLIVVGRYPDGKDPAYVPGEKRTVDVIDAEDGTMVCQLQDPAAPGIVSLNKFNHQGDKLASCMGVNILIWNRKERLVEEQELMMRSLVSGRTSQALGNNSQSVPKRRGQADQKKNKKEKKSTKSKTQTKTKLGSER